ncbi:MAG: hypothetical protein EA379_11495 [Phycisphaerales bacterium]|nr:MAG: hypothetical protein EA379_11495 [Phycisphaerales bacterium]
MMRVSKAQFAGGVVVGVVGASLIGVGGMAFAQTQRAQPVERDAQVRVGTYTPQTAFSQYRGADAINERAERLQIEMQEAQQGGDQQRMMELQSEMQQLQMAQQQIVERFFAEVERAVPEVAREAGVSVFAVEIVYTAAELGEPMDLTPQVVERINKNAD